MKKGMHKAVAGAMCMTMVLSSTGSVALAKESKGLIIAPNKQHNAVSKEESKKNVLNVTKEMTNAKGVLELKNEVWDSIYIPRDIEAKKVVIDNVTADDIVIESGTTATFEVNNSAITSIEVTAPQIEVIDIAKIKELLAAGEDSSVVAEMNRQYLSQKNLFNKIQPKITFGAGTQIKTVKMSGNANLNFASSKVTVENVEIKITDAQKKLNISLAGFEGNVSIAEDKNNKDTGKNLLKLDLKNSEVKELKMDGSKNNSYSINSKGNSKVENLEVKGSSAISLGVATGNVTLDKSSEGAALRVYSVIATIVVEGAKNEIILSNNATVGNAQVKGDSTKIYGNGKLESAEITGSGANVSTPGTAVEGTNDKTPPVNGTSPSTPSTPSRPSTPSTPSNPSKPDTEVEVTEGDYTYYENVDENGEKDGTITIADFTNEKATKVTIPETINGLKVTAIGEYAFEWLYNLKEVVLPNTVIEIGNDAFYGCESLEKIVLPEGLKKIGSYAFGDCYKLAKITIPESVVQMGYGVFNYCENLKELYIPKNVAIFGEYSTEDSYFSTMWGLNSLEKVVVAEENPILTAKNGILYSKDETVLLYVPNAYAGEVSVPKTVKEIDYNAFVDCHKMTKLVIPKEFEGDNYAFDYASGLTSLKEFVVEEGNPYYYSENGLLFEDGGLIKVPVLAIPAEYELPSKLANGNELYYIYSDAFIDCSNLTSVTLSETIEDISSAQCFRHCNALKEIKVVKENPYFNSINGVLYSEDGKTVVAFPRKYAEKSYKVLDGVTTIGSYAFCYAFNLENISLPSTLTEIDDSGFYNCNGLKEVKLPDSVTVLLGNAFGYCHNLTSVQLSNNLEVIGYGAFRGCRKLEKIDIPATVTELGRSAFSGCDALIEFVIPEGITEVADSLLNSCDNLVSVTIPDSVTTIGDSAFSYSPKLTEITIPDSVTKIGYGAFSSCIGLTELVIPDGVTAIEGYTFSYCTGLTSFAIPETVKRIEYDAFANCTGLKEITIPDSVKYIGNRAFEKCTALEKIIISSSVKEMGYEVFKNAKNVVIYTPEGSVADEYAKANNIKVEYIEDTYVPTIEDFMEWTNIWIDYDKSGLEIREFTNKEATTLEIPETIEGRNVVSIANSVFANMTKLETVVLPKTLSYIKDFAFSNCTNLKEVWIPSKDTHLNPNVFDGCSEDLIIYTVEGSHAETYGDENGITVRYIGAEDVERVPIKWSTIASGLGAGGVAVSEVLDKELTKVVVPATREGNDVIKIGNRAFADMSALTEVVLPETMKYIEAYAFSNCTALTTINFPKNIEKILTCAFENCTSLTKVEFPNSLQYISPSAFKNCTNLKEVVIPSKDTFLYENVFEGCTNVVIYTVKGSKAEEYAKKYDNITVKYIGEEDIAKPALPVNDFYNFAWVDEEYKSLSITGLKNKKFSDKGIYKFNDAEDSMEKGYKVISIAKEAFNGVEIASGSALEFYGTIKIGEHAFANLQIASTDALGVVKYPEDAPITVKIADDVEFEDNSFASPVGKIIFDVSKVIRERLEAILDDYNWNWEFKDDEK